MPPTLKEAANKLGIALPLIESVQQAIKQPRDGQQVYVVSASQSGLILEHKNGTHVIKITACLASANLLRDLVASHVPGLPEVSNEYGICGTTNVNGASENLYAFEVKKYTAHIEEWGDNNKALAHAAHQLSFAACNKDISSSAESIDAIDRLLNSSSEYVSDLNFAQALNRLRSFYEAHRDKQYSFELPQADWFIDDDQVVNVDPVVDLSRYRA